MYLMTCTRPDLAYPLCQRAKVSGSNPSVCTSGIPVRGGVRVEMPEQASTSTLAHRPSVSSPDTTPLDLRLRDFLDHVVHTDSIPSLSAPPSDESVELSGPYPELVGCLMYLMTCTRPDLAYPLSLLARYMAPGRHRKQTSQGYTFSLGSGSVSWRSTCSSSVLSSSCEAEIYAGAMAA
ncbi:unnamed protein product [Closterium sp. NIES-53]